MATDLPALPRVDPEVEQSRESAARLLNAFARQLRRTASLDRLARRKPALALSLAMAAGFLMGTTVGRRVFR